MEPRIQYAKTKDGVSIAYWVIGQGPPLVCLPEPPFNSHIQLEWQVPQYRKVYELGATRRSVVRFDARGLGLSDRNVDDLSLDSRILDLEAVVDTLGYDTFALSAVTYATQLAIAYAARCPERVSHLALVSAVASGSDLMRVPRWQALRNLLESDWELFVENLAALSYAPGGEEARALANFFRASVTQDTARRYFDLLDAEDVTDLLPQVSAPALLIHLRGLSYLGIDSARNLASAIPNARLVVLDGDYQSNLETISATFNEFLAEGEEATQEPALPEGTAIILFADIADSTALTEQLGDTAFRTKATALDGLLRKLIREAGGTPVEGKVLGDGVMAVFTSARGAIDCALRCKEAGDEGGLPLHLGIHAGDVIREGNTVYGGAVNLAQRVADACPAGEVFVSDTLRGLARTSTEVGFEDRGEHELKGIPERQRLWAAREQG